jgi:hypothetical protein
MEENSKTQSIQLANDKIQALIDELKDISLEIEKTRNYFNSQLDSIESNVKQSLSKIDELSLDLDTIENEFQDELDKLILEQTWQESLEDEELGLNLEEE